VDFQLKIPSQYPWWYGQIVDERFGGWGFTEDFESVEERIDALVSDFPALVTKQESLFANLLQESHSHTKKHCEMLAIC